MSTTLWVLCGVPGSGKTYFAKNILEKNDQRWFYVSRDEIRFSLVQEDEEYFSKENEVFNLFCHKINFFLGLIDSNVIADATHLTTASRMKLLKHLNLKNVNVIPVWMNTPEHICLKRNEKRSGREHVPKSVIRKMYLQRNHPCNDNFKYAGVLEVSGI